MGTVHGSVSRTVSRAWVRGPHAFRWHGTLVIVDMEEIVQPCSSCARKDILYVLRLAVHLGKVVSLSARVLCLDQLIPRGCTQGCGELGCVFDTKVKAAYATYLAVIGEPSLKRGDSSTTFSLFLTKQLIFHQELE